MISLDYSVGNLEDTFISSKMEQQKKLETSQAFFDILSSCVNAKVILQFLKKYFDSCLIYS